MQINYNIFACGANIIEVAGEICNIFASAETRVNSEEFEETGGKLALTGDNWR